MKAKTVFDKVDNVVYRALRIVSYMATAFLALIMVIAVVNVILEKLAKAGLPVSGVASSTNWIQFLNVGVVYLATAYVTLERGHAGVDLLTKHYPKTVQRILYAFAHLSGSVVIGYIAYRGFVKVLAEQLSNNARINSTLGSSFPQWPFGVIYCVGMSLFAFSFFWGFLRICFNKPAASEAADLDEVREGILKDEKGGDVS